MVTKQLKYCAVTGGKNLCWLSHPSAAVLVLEVRRASDIRCQVFFGGSSLTAIVQHCPGVLAYFSRIKNGSLSLNRCDADPSALANYVVALVKKDKPEKELKAFCADQLDVFLQKGTVLSIA